MHFSRRTLLLALTAGTLPWPAARAAAAKSTHAAPDLVLPSLYDNAIDPTPYLVSEKYDGVRGHWDGTTLRHRSGRVVAAPSWFTSRLPNEPLDGELWLGRGRFDELSAIVRRDVPVDAEWRALRYMVFELPGAVGRFDERARRIGEIATRTGWPQLVAVAQSRVADRAALQRRLDETVVAGGEGLVLHLASAGYAVGRSDVMMKLKPEHDAEATVVAYHGGQGRYQGLVGALEVRTPEGRRFLIGSGLSDALRRKPPALGTSITYRYRDFTASGLPRFATFLRVHDAAL